MKIKQRFLAALLLGLAAGAIRIAQYLFSIDAEGYYLKTNTADFLNGALIGLATVGAIFCLLAARFKKQQTVDFGALCNQSLLRIVFLLTALWSVADGVLRLIGQQPLSALPVATALFGLLSALCWLLAALNKSSGILPIFPVLHLCLIIVSYFWQTYKYIHISGYVLGILGLCAVLLFSLSLMKGLCGGCTQGELLTGGGLTLFFAPAALLAPIVGMVKNGFEPATLSFAACGLLFWLMALLTVSHADRVVAEPTEAENPAPDPEQLNEYLSEIPETEEQSNDE